MTLDASKSKQQFCAYCGCDIGFYWQPYPQRDTCGKRECEREMSYLDAEARESAHDQLDRDMGWGA
jgi:hypothetical protein